jgi:hypothetical protein
MQLKLVGVNGSAPLAEPVVLFNRQGSKWKDGVRGLHMFLDRESSMDAESSKWMSYLFPVILSAGQSQRTFVQQDPFAIEQSAHARISQPATGNDYQLQIQNLKLFPLPSARHGQEGGVVEADIVCSADAAAQPRKRYLSRQSTPPA